MVTFRLVDALPAVKLAELNQIASAIQDADRPRRIEAYLDAGHGARYLSNERVAACVESALQAFDGTRYRLLAWVVMPNHVHVLVEISEAYPLSRIVHTWKSYTAKEANRLLARTGEFWQREYFDRAIRDEKHLEAAVRYIHENPVKAGLAASTVEWLYSSARRYLG
jgi:REP element-mobilizing transposase RayT